MDRRDAATGDIPDDEAVRQDITDWLKRQQAIDRAAPCADVQTGDLQVNVFSITFRAWSRDGCGSSVFVKIPKADLRRRQSGIMPLTSDDRLLGSAEYSSLQFLAANWLSDDLRVSFVKPLRYLESYNAIVTEEAAAADGCERLRRWDLRRRIGDQRSAARIRAVMSRIGQALGRFHERTSRPAAFDGRLLHMKIERYVDALSRIVGDLPALGATRAAASGIAMIRRPAVVTSTLKGLDVRNVLLADDDRVVLLDPGRRKVTWPEADLARFLVTYRILWWGSFGFIVGLRPDVAAEQAFLQAYDRPSRTDDVLFHAQMIKELLKHWYTAHDSLRLKPWPDAVKRMLATGWIDRFYSGQLLRETARLS